MNKIKILMSVLLAATIMVTGCSDDKGSAAKAVLTSASGLQFKATNASPQTITVYADGDWSIEAPEWVKISPAQGSGTTEVTIVADDNLRDGSIDNPRRATVVFKGATVASRANLVVNQEGDKYRDCQVFTVGDIYAADDEAFFETKPLTVAALTTSGAIATDNGTDFMFISTPETLAVGDVVTAKAQKLTDDASLAYIVPDELTVTASGQAVTLPTPVDVTESLSLYAPGKREYITARGILSGSMITVNGQSLNISTPGITEADAQKLAALSGHIVQLNGFYAGTASPVFKVNFESVADLGEALEIYWTEDFEWLDPWAEASSSGSTVETDNPDATAPQIVNAAANGLTALQALEARGYRFERVSTKTLGECIYLQRNYLKFGKTSYQAGIILPPVTNVPAGTKAILSFDWCPMRQGSGKIDPVNLLVIVTNGGVETEFEVPTHGWANNHKLEWINAVVELDGVEINANTQIFIRQTQWPAATANRWFLDNIKIYSRL